MWDFLRRNGGTLRGASRDAAHVVIFLLGVGAAAVGILSHDLGLVACAITLFGLIGIVRA